MTLLRCCCTPRRAPSPWYPAPGSIAAGDLARIKRRVLILGDLRAGVSSDRLLLQAQLDDSGETLAPHLIHNSRPALDVDNFEASPRVKENDPYLHGPDDNFNVTRRRPLPSSRSPPSSGAALAAVSTATAAVATVAAVSTVAFGAAVGPCIALAAAGPRDRSDRRVSVGSVVAALLLPALLMQSPGPQDP